MKFFCLSMTFLFLVTTNLNSQYATFPSSDSQDAQYATPSTSDPQEPQYATSPTSDPQYATEKKVKSIYATPLVTDLFLQAMEFARASLRDSKQAIKYYQQAFNEIAGQFITYNVQIDYAAKNIYPIITFDSMVNLILSDLNQRSQNILITQQKGNNYVDSLKVFNDDLSTYNGYIKASIDKFTSGGSTALAGYQNQRDALVFQLYFKLLTTFSAQNSSPSQADLDTARSYFDICDNLWNSSNPPAWTATLTLPGYGKGDQIRQALYTVMATMYSTYANNKLNDLQNIQTIDQFSSVMQINIALIADSQAKFNQAGALYATLAANYKTNEYNLLKTTYQKLSGSFGAGIKAYNARDYLAAAKDLGNAIVNGVPVVSNMLTMKGQQLIGDAAVAAGKNATSKIVSNQIEAIKNEKALMDSSKLSPQLSFINDFSTNISSAQAQYKAAMDAYQVASQMSDSPKIKSSFASLANGLQVANDMLDNIADALLLVKNADLLVPYVTQVSDVDSVDKKYKQAVALSKTADSKKNESSSSLDYIQFYAVLGADWSFETFFGQRIGLLLKQKAESVLAGVEITNLTISQQALVVDLYLKAYGYKDYLSDADQQAIQDALKQVDLIGKADELKAIAQQAKDWTPQKNLDYYTSLASSAWKNAITAYLIAYEINASNPTLFKGVDQMYHQVLDEYGQAYLDNVSDVYNKEAGASIIYYRAYLNRLAEGDNSGAKIYETNITDLITTFFGQLSKVMTNIKNSNYDVARYYYDKALSLQVNIEHLVAEQATIIDNQNKAKKLPATTKKLYIKTNTSGLTISSDFITPSISFGNLESDFASWSVKQGDAALASADTMLNSAASSYGAQFDRQSVLDAQVQYSLANRAYQGAIELYTKINNSAEADSVTAKQSNVENLVYASAMLATVNPQESATYYNNNVFNLYFLKPSYSVVPDEIKNSDILGFLSKYSLSVKDQKFLYRLAAEYTIFQKDWELFVQYLNQLQFPAQYPIKNDSWQNMKNLFSAYSLTDSEIQQLNALQGTYTMPSAVQNAISAYLFYLPTMMYLYSDLYNNGLKLSDYNLTYQQVVAYLASLKGAPVADGSALSVALGSGAVAIREYLINANTYFLKTVQMLASNLKGITGSLLLYSYANTLKLVENQKITLALPPSYLSWYPTPDIFYTKAQQYFGLNQQTIKEVITKLSNRLWLSSASQTQLKIDYILGKYTDEQMIQALSFIDEYEVLVPFRNRMAALISLYNNKEANPQTILNATLTDSDSENIRVVKYIYLEIASGVTGSGLGKLVQNDIMGAVQQEYGATLAKFLVGNPSSRTFSSLLSDVSSQYLAAQGFYTQQNNKDAAAIELSTIFSTYGKLASIRALPMDTKQVVPGIFARQGFTLYDWSTAASLYANSATAASNIVKQKNQANVDSLRSYYQIVVQNMTAYVLLRAAQGGSFDSLAQTYARWLAQQSSIEKEVITITQNNIDLYQSINNLILDSLIYSLTISSTANSLTAATNDTIKKTVSDYLTQKNIKKIFSDTTTFNTTTWQDLQNLLTKAFDDLVPASLIATNIDAAMLTIAALGEQLYGLISARYIIDWESDDVDAGSAQTAIDNLIAAMQARESAVMTIDYLG